MIYFICQTPQCGTINKAPGIPSNDWLCAECGMRLVYNRVHMYVNRGAPMRNAIYAPHGGPVSEFDLQYYEAHQKEPDPPVQNVTTTTPSQSNVNTTPMIDLSKPLTPPELVELVIQPQQKAVVTEAISQNELYQPLADKGYLFLRRDGQFGKLKLGKQIYDPEETVPEPAVTSKGYQKQPYGPFLVGRGEVNMIYSAGSVTYPDFVVFRDQVVYFIELKTPRNWTFKKYLSDHFYTEKVFGGRSIVDEIEARHALTPSHAENIFLFDIRNNTDTQQAITDLGSSISYGGRKQWWLNYIKGVMFYSDAGLSKKFVIEEILSGQSITNTKQQTNIKSFFKPK